MSKMNAKRISSIAICIAIVTVFTIIIKIPTGKGYIHLGDLAIGFIALTLGPITAFISAALGTAIADIMVGYANWAPISFIVHGLEGLIIAWIVKNRSSIVTKIIAIVVGTIIVPLGYYLGSAIILSYGFSAALVDVPTNTLQAAVGIILGFLVSEQVKKAYPPVKDLTW